MTYDQEPKPKKLTLGGSKLSLNKPSQPTNVTRGFVSSAKTIVEVRKSSTTTGALSFNKLWSNGSTAQSGESAAGEEFNRRLTILKKAAEDAKSKIIDTKISTLSKLASINQSTSQNDLEEDTIENTQPENVHSQTPQNESQNIENDPEVLPTLATPSAQDKNLSKPFVRSPVIGSQSHFGVALEDISSTDKADDNKIVVPKVKIEEPKKLKKADIFNMLDADGSNNAGKTRSLASIRRAREKEKRKAYQQTPDKVYREVIIPEAISVGDLANRMSERATDVIKELMKLGIMATTSQTIDTDTAELIATTLGHTVKRVQESDVENILISEADKEEDLKHRAPIVTIMGHVDHGKTSLLDALKSTDLASQEAGGITQHIGAYRVTLPDGRAITFIDTPGHEAFSEMRTRGAKVTDIVVIVVAADDGIKPQTIEAINHAKAANVPIIVAINKIDKPDINLDRIKNDLLMYDLVSEELGGDTIIVPVSALKKTNLDKLEDAILLVAEMQDLKANFSGLTAGVVIEAKVDKGKGAVATILVQRGTLRNGDIVVAGTKYGKIKRMNNDKGVDITEAEPSLPVEIYGLNEAPRAGDQFNVVQNEKQARDIVEYRERLAKEKKISVTKRSSLEELFLKASGNTGMIKELPIIIKGDVQGSIEAIVTSLLKLPNDEVRVRILHHAVGGILESDVTLAKASNAIIIGFNVRTNNNAFVMAEKEKVDIRYYSLIYNLLDDVKSILSGMLSPIIREQHIGTVEIRQIFTVSKVGKIAGSYVTKGTIKRGARTRLLRDNIVIHEGKLKTLKRFKDDVKEVHEGFECGIAFENYENIEQFDIVEVFEIIEEKKQLL
ncbi:translation initiation factor IF-2 [Rickettsia endosymbiont of Oedothorax gibbosus]|uniref:translation initiation factor IF-2 n=1 Tax=Rickettsia endosymbiont of Oedothorax gibbosus TaxID=931099 RepID=UPI00202554B3|nr:translation initiation factor IF-2 [Rickettsia endosymbiont of Oedothorax gibbosus]